MAMPEILSKAGWRKIIGFGVLTDAVVFP